jgi:hypothetical protein
MTYVADKNGIIIMVLILWRQITSESIKSSQKSGKIEYVI